MSLLSRIASVLKGLSEGAHKSVWYPGLLLNGMLGYLSTYVVYLWVEGDSVQPDLNSILTNVRYHVKNIGSITGGNTYTGYLPPTVRVRETFCNPLVLPTTIIEILVVQNAKVLVQTI